ncbi:hypothetical protein DAERI_010490 [Deinococcus aerius]|uniref:Lipoprotein n=1 Tax=Deinococcus aerius TaxID=200253 RepID=A0A2I9DED9_9DEIO|nr:hypothetical protein [Deinococcus aerius]GBF04318.1 hypothetical protein DAERI_010490 [Deinococcus aerius]
MKNFTETVARAGRRRWLLGVVVLAGLGACGSPPDPAPVTPCEESGCPAPEPPPPCTVSDTCPPPTAEDPLKSGPRPPGNISRFPQSLYPAAAATAPAAGPALDEKGVLAQLTGYLDVEYPDDPQGKQAMLELFGAPRLRQKVANPTLRASLVAYTATARDLGVADFILNAKTESGEDKVQAVAFLKFSGSEDSAAARVRLTTRGQMYIDFNDVRRFEHFALSACSLFHEVLHQDAAVALMEEATLYLSGVACEIKVLARHPELAALGTQDARFLNARVAFLLNSRAPASGKIDIFAEQGKQLMPGSTVPSTQWWSHFTRYVYTMFAPEDRTPTPGNDLLQAYFPECDARQFDMTFLQCVNAHLPVTREEMLAAMNALELNLGK